MKWRCIMPTFGYLPYQGWAFLFIFPTLKHFPINSCIFRKKSVILQKKKRCQQYSYFLDLGSCFIQMIMNRFMFM